MVYNGPANCGPFISMETLRRRRRSLRTNKCEIRCIHNAKGWFARNSPPTRSWRSPRSRGGNQLDTERKRCVCSRERDERRKIAMEDQRSNCFMKNYDAVTRVQNLNRIGINDRKKDKYWKCWYRRVYGKSVNLWSNDQKKKKEKSGLTRKIGRGT